LRRKKKKEKNREQSIMNQKGEVITIDSVMNAIVSDAINKATLSTTKPGIHSSQINKQTNKHILCSSQTFNI
jgi:tetrahydromethanopterin S-methyltransferase subunit A